MNYDREIEKQYHPENFIKACDECEMYDGEHAYDCEVFLDDKPESFIIGQINGVQRLYDNGILTAVETIERMRHLYIQLARKMGKTNRGNYEF